MRQYFVFADQRRRGNLRHHETGIQSRALGQKWRQSLAERGIHQAFDASFADASQRAQSNAKKIQSESQRLAVEISAGDNIVSPRNSRRQPCP